MAVLASTTVAVWAFVFRSPVPILDWFDFGIHEAGHLLAFPLPEHFMLMAGSFAQIAFPVSMAWYFGVRRRDPAGGGFCLAWAGASAWDVSIYAGDAVEQSLPLVGGGLHDWAGILTHYDALHLTEQIAGGILLGGALLAAFGIGIAGAGLISGLTAPRATSVVAPPSGSGPSFPERTTEDPWVAASQLPFRHEEPPPVRAPSASK